MASIQRIAFRGLEAEPNFPALVDEYAAECGIIGLPHPRGKWETYRMLDDTNALTTFAAFHNETLIGFILVLLPVLPHYSETVAIGESFFVGRKYRYTGAGTALRLAAEDWAEVWGAFGLLLSTPEDGILADILPNVGYTGAGKVFFKPSKWRKK